MEILVKNQVCPVFKDGSSAQYVQYNILPVSHIQLLLCEYVYSTSVKSIHFGTHSLKGKVLP